MIMTCQGKSSRGKPVTNVKKEGYGLWLGVQNVRMNIARELQCAQNVDANL